MQNLFENLRDFFVAETSTEEGLRFAGTGALHVLWGDIAEIRGLAVAPDVQARGVGSKLVAACEAEARRLGIPTLFAWTYAVGFFERCGFRLIDKSRELHPRVWSECLRCPFFRGCNENGLVKKLEGVPFPKGLPKPPPGSGTPGNLVASQRRPEDSEEFEGPNTMRGICYDRSHCDSMPHMPM